MESKSLEVQEVHFYEKKNAEKHHTINFGLLHIETPSPVLRRGQTFIMLIRFNRKYDREADIVKLIYKFGSSTNFMKGTRGICIVNDQSDVSNCFKWGVRIRGERENDLILEVMSPVDSPVGIWDLEIETNLCKGNQPPINYRYNLNIFLLFNPWVKGIIIFYTSNLKRSSESL